MSDVSVPQSWPRWAHSVSHTGVTVERSIKFGIDQNRDAAANCWRLAPLTHAGRTASSPEIFRPFLTVCLTVFPFEFRPRTFTIGFYRKKSFISELMILECSFPLSVPNRFTWAHQHNLPWPRLTEVQPWSQCTSTRLQQLSCRAHKKSWFYSVCKWLQNIANMQMYAFQHTRAAIKKIEPLQWLT